MMNRFVFAKSLAAFGLAIFAADGSSALAAQEDRGSGEQAAHAQHSENAEHEAASPFEGSLINSITTIVIFAVLLIVLGKFAWGPILAVLQKREEFIRRSLDEARKEREDAEAKLNELNDRLNKAREEAAGILEDGRRDAETVHRSIESQARAEADAMIDRAKKEIQIAGETAIRDLYEAAGDMATQIATRIIRKEITGGDHERLIQESIDEMRKLHEGGNGFRKAEP